MKKFHTVKHVLAPPLCSHLVKRKEIHGVKWYGNIGENVICSWWFFLIFSNGKAAWHHVLAPKAEKIRKQFFLIALHSDHVDWLASSVQNCNRCLVFALGIREAPVFPVGIATEGRLLPANPVQQPSAAGKPQHRFQVKTQPFALCLCCTDLHGEQGWQRGTGDVCNTTELLAQF